MSPCRCMTWHCLTPTRRPRHFSRAAQDPALGLPFPPNAISPPDTKPRVKTAERFGSTPNTTCLSGTKPRDKCVERFRVFYLTPFLLPEPKLPLQLFVYPRPLKDAIKYIMLPPPRQLFITPSFPTSYPHFHLPLSFFVPRNQVCRVSAPRSGQSRCGGRGNAVQEGRKWESLPFW